MATVERERERESRREYAVNLKTAVLCRGYIYLRKYGKTYKQMFIIQ
jgi:hypothetical protein